MTAAEEMRIPILSDSPAPPFRIKVSRSTKCLIILAIFIAIVLIISFFIDICMNGNGYQPEIRIDSAFVCPINTSDSMIWDLKLDITNISNHTRLCIAPFDLSVFSYYNGTIELVRAKAALTKICVEPGSHTSAIMWVESPLLLPQFQGQGQEDPNGLIRFDLKFEGRFYFTYHYAPSLYGGYVVCKDIKVATNTSSSSCGALVEGVPFGCFYDTFVQLN